MRGIEKRKFESGEFNASSIMVIITWCIAHAL